MIGQFLSLHADYEAKYPDELDIAEQYERARQAQHMRVHGTLDAYRPDREFPCRGALRVAEERADGITVVRCDACRFETTTRLRPVHDHAEPAREPAPF